VTDLAKETLNQIKRDLNLEFVQMEEDFDKTRDLRSEITDKLHDAVRGISLVNSDNTGLSADAELQLKVINTALKSLSDTEKAKASAIGLKLKQKEIEVVSAAESRERLELVLRATAPGRIQEGFSAEDMGQHLGDMFDGEIKDFELKANPRDLSEES
jgi:hypothetical protein